MNRFWILPLILTLGLFSCDSGAGKEKGATNLELGAGPDFETVVLSFDADAGKTEIELINRMDEGVTNISGRFVFMNEAGEPLTRANGNPITSPFQNMTNPHLVGAKSKKTIVLGNSIQKGTASISLSDVKIKTTSGEEIIVD